jgi:hypothetical protein
MPKFLYSVIASMIIFWVLAVRFITLNSPNTPKNILSFLALFLVALCFTLSLVIYYFLYKKAATYTDLKSLYRKGLKWGFIYSLGIVGLMFLKAFQFLNIVTGILYLVLYFSILYKVNKRH